jgi:hypothetical protein
MPLLALVKTLKSTDPVPALDATKPNVSVPEVEIGELESAKIDVDPSPEVLVEEPKLKKLAEPLMLSELKSEKSNGVPLVASV